MTPSFDDLKAVFAKVEASGHSAVYDHEWMRLAMQHIADLEASRIDSYRSAIDLLQRLAHWFRDNNHAYYFAVDTKQVNEDEVPITCILHSLHIDDQFKALHKYVEQSRQNMKEKMEGNNEN